MRKVLTGSLLALCVAAAAHADGLSGPGCYINAPCNAGSFNATGTALPTNGIYAPSTTTVGIAAGGLLSTTFGNANIGSGLMQVTTGSANSGLAMVMANTSNGGSAFSQIIMGNDTGPLNGASFTLQSSANSTGNGVKSLSINTNNGVLALQTSGVNGLTVDTSQHVVIPLTATIGQATSLTTVTGELGFAKITASGSAPGASGGKMELVCGTAAGSAKLITYAGTSTTPVTIVDNIGSGVTGC